MAVKPDAERPAPPGMGAVFAEEIPAPVSRLAGVKLPGTKLMVFAALIGMILSVLGVGYLYVDGGARMRGEAAAIADHRHNPAKAVNDLVEDARQWALSMGLAAIAGGALLFLVTLMGSRLSNRKWRAQMEIQVGDLLASQTKNHKETESRIQRLLAQVADARVCEEEARKAEAEAKAMISESETTFEELQAEIGRLKEVEKSLYEQAELLERSKGNLELHVQARTVELQKRQRNFEAILDSAGEGICGFDLSGRAVFVNPAAAGVLGWEVKELIGRTEDAFFFPPKMKGVHDAPGFFKDDQGEYLLELDGLALELEAVAKRLNFPQRLLKVMRGDKRELLQLGIRPGEFRRLVCQFVFRQLAFRDIPEKNHRADHPVIFNHRGAHIFRDHAGAVLAE